MRGRGRRRASTAWGTGCSCAAALLLWWADLRGAEENQNQFFGKDLRKSALRETLPNVLIEVHRLGCAQCGEVGWKNQ